MVSSSQNNLSVVSNTLIKINAGILLHNSSSKTA